jgi:hypothetical protein
MIMYNPQRVVIIVVVAVAVAGGRQKAVMDNMRENEYMNTAKIPFGVDITSVSLLLFYANAILS